MDLTFSSFGDGIVWRFMVQIFILSIALVLGNTIRRKVPFIRRSLMPTALVGGLLLLPLKFIPAINEKINVSVMEMVTYHCLAIGFIALALKKGKKEKTSVKTILEAGALTGATYVLQAVIGLAVTITLSLVLTEGFFPGGGVLLTLGFGQGTGQALTYGKLYETEYGFVGGETFGLSIAAVGFLVASVVGVVYMNILRSKGKLVVLSEKHRNSEKIEDYVLENDIPNNESIDKFTMNVILVLFIYAITYFIMKLINVNLVWGFNFLIGSIFALIVKKILELFQKKGICVRNLTNDYLLDRLSGFVFDIMILAGVMAIDVQQLSSMWWQLLIICTLGTVGTFVYVNLASKQLFKGYESEGFLSMFGMLTGTASNGMILLREIDPNFETPAATNLVFQSIPAMVFGGGLLILLGYCPLGLKQAIISLVILSVALTGFTLILFRKSIFKKIYSKQS